MPPQPDIRKAETDDALLAIYRFRYAIYVEEMNRVQKHANASERTIIDPLDAASDNIAAWVDDQVVACVRLTWPRKTKGSYMEDYEALYQMHRFGELHPGRTSIVTRLMIAPAHRRTNLAFRLFSFCYTIGLDTGTALNVMDCNAHLVEFFRKVGYRPYMGSARHDEYGEVTPMYLDLRDVSYLRKLGSPYVKAYEAWIARNAPEAQALPWQEPRGRHGISEPLDTSHQGNRT